MNQFLGLFLLLISSLSFAGNELPDCTPTMPAGSLCREKISNVKPDQMDIGKREVDRKAEKLKNFSASEYKKYLEKNAIPSVIGPGGKYYIVDHHHLIAALDQNGVHHVELNIIQNWSLLDSETFWKKMQENHYVYLKDRYGSLITPDQLPASIKEMGNDVFRSIAGAVVSKGAYANAPESYFIEFQWALFFRKYFTEEEAEKHYKKTVEEAVKLAQSKEAKGLPGYTPIQPCDDALDLAKKSWPDTVRHENFHLFNGSTNLLVTFISGAGVHNYGTGRT